MEGGTGGAWGYQPTSLHQAHCSTPQPHRSYIYLALLYQWSREYTKLTRQQTCSCETWEDMGAEAGRHGHGMAVVRHPERQLAGRQAKQPCIFQAQRQQRHALTALTGDRLEISCAFCYSLGICRQAGTWANRPPGWAVAFGAT